MLVTGTTACAMSDATVGRTVWSVVLQLHLQDHALDRAQHGARDPDCADLRRNDEVELPPHPSQLEPTLVLRRTMHTQRCDRFGRQRHRPPRTGGLRRHLHTALARDVPYRAAHADLTVLQVDIGPTQSERVAPRRPCHAR